MGRTEGGAWRTMHSPLFKVRPPNWMAQDMRSVMTTAVVRPVFRACALNISVTQNLEITPVHLHGTSSKNAGFMKLISLATGFRKMGVLKQLKTPGVCRHCFASTQCPIYRGADSPLMAPSNPPRALTSPGCWAVAEHSAWAGTPSLHNTNSPASKGAW